ncbi:T9SS type A sorting domain-containing protein [Ulvibacterium sp.]|uniref:T9SS type A sorting domain-containing protein n=1 Tax=Ulvibacterium sp. TaxID=2665914 RepID=UPI003CC69CEB
MKKNYIIMISPFFFLLNHGELQIQKRFDNIYNTGKIKDKQEVFFTRNLPLTSENNNVVSPFINKPIIQEPVGVKAFPTAYGGGSGIIGGRGGTIVHVTNLSDDGNPGSLRYALLLETPRTIVFDVSGIIELNNIIEIPLAASNFTVAGQTAPEGGITISGFPISMGGGWILSLQPCNNGIWRFIRFRNGTTTGIPDQLLHSGFISTGTDGLIMDHCSFAMNDDQAMSLNANYGSLANHTISRCLFSENATNIVWGINPPTGSTGNFSYLFNLHSHQGWRNPNLGYEGRADVINNVYFNWSFRNININGRSPDLNHYNNYYKAGSYRSSDNKLQTGNTTTDPTIYTSNNYHSILATTPVSDDRQLWTDFSTGSPVANQYFVTTPHAAMINPAPLLTASEAYAEVLSDVGANRYVADAGVRGEYLDSYDTQRINDVINSISRDPLNKSWTQPILPNNIRSSNWDTDNDGLPDFFENSHGVSNPSEVKNNYDFPEYIYPNVNNYAAIEVYLAYAAGDLDKLEKVGGNDNLFNINGTPKTVDSYDPASQDSGSFDIQDGGNTLRLTGNAWKKTALDYNITVNTVLQFDLRVTGTGEIHGIAFDDDNTLGGETLFQFAGTQTDYGIQNYATYSGNGWVSFSVPVGQYVTGSPNHIVFVADKDSNPETQESFFRNVTLSEPTSFNINGTPKTVDSYDPASQDSGSFDIQDGGNTLRLTGNAWKKTALDYNITVNTVLQFDLRVTGTGEIHGIAFDDDNTLGGETLFQFAGTQTDYGIQNYATYSGNGWVSFSVPVGQYVTGSPNHIVFVADKDSNPETQESFFRNVTLSEPTSFNINGTPKTVDSYDPASQDSGSFDIQDGGNTLRLTGNAWKKTALDYNITVNTVLQFDLRVTGTGEIHGIAFDDDNTLGGQTLFQFAGTQNDLGIQNYATYSGNGWVSFSVPVGQYVTGSPNHIVFVADKDSNPETQESFFRNVIFSEGSASLKSKVSIEESDEIPIVSLYPNEADKLVTLKSKEILKSVSIYSIDGRVVKQIPHLNTSILNIDLYDVPNGLYIIEFSTNDLTHTKKLIVQH